MNVILKQMALTVLMPSSHAAWRHLRGLSSETLYETETPLNPIKPRATNSPSLLIHLHNNCHYIRSFTIPTSHIITATRPFCLTFFWGCSWLIKFNVKTSLSLATGEGSCFWHAGLSGLPLLLSYLDKCSYHSKVNIIRFFQLLHKLINGISILRNRMGRGVPTQPLFKNYIHASG